MKGMIPETEKEMKEFFKKMKNFKFVYPKCFKIIRDKKDKQTYSIKENTSVS